MNEERISEDQDIGGQGISSSGNQDREKKYIAGFEKLWVWQKAHKLMLEMHDVSRTLPLQERYRMKDQIERASSSVPDNIAEGHTSYYYLDKIKGFRVARKEAGETQNHIRAMEGKKYITLAKAEELMMRYEEIIRGINGYINWVREKRGAAK